MQGENSQVQSVAGKQDSENTEMSDVISKKRKRTHCSGLAVSDHFSTPSGCTDFDVAQQKKIESPIMFSSKSTSTFSPLQTCPIRFGDQLSGPNRNEQVPATRSANRNEHFQISIAGFANTSRIHSLPITFSGLAAEQSEQQLPSAENLLIQNSVTVRRVRTDELAKKTVPELAVEVQESFNLASSIPRFEPIQLPEFQAINSPKYKRVHRGSLQSLELPSRVLPQKPLQLSPRLQPLPTSNQKLAQLEFEGSRLKRFYSLKEEYDYKRYHIRELYMRELKILEDEAKGQGNKEFQVAMQSLILYSDSIFDAIQAKSEDYYNPVLLSFLRGLSGEADGQKTEPL
ncbi:uncharacterized protein V1516DRAFT_666544 [Lipomyces oligophaga]|uniref:uncharacterized protein n=1 Tax=Lipomyces oligophaga TaxID=45792 RepID=UPI0034CE12BB